MPRFIKIILIFCFVIITSWILARLTGVFLSFNAATPANEPGIKFGSKFFGSNLLEAQRLKYVCYNGMGYDSVPSIMIYRLCGVEGDMIHIKNGILFINGKNIDQDLQLKHFYLVANADINELPLETQADELVIVDYDADYKLVNLEDKWVNENPGLKLNRFIDTVINQEIKYKFLNNWSPDNFGPVKVPEGKMFLLGDNRHNAWDSRYQGFIDKNAFLATVLWNK